MTALTILTGAAVFLAGMLTGRAWPARRRKPKPVEPKCGCGHHFSFHDPRTSACHEKVYQGNGYYPQCTCRAYSGPTPMPEYFAPEIESTR